MSSDQPILLVTGANRGIGFGFVERYAADGWRVIATCREPRKAEALQKLARQNPAVQIETLDVADQASIDALASKLHGQALDILVNGAGIYSGGDNRDETQVFGTIDAEAWDKVLRTNTIAPVMVTQALLPNLRLGKERKVIMISSMMGSISRETHGAIAYRTSKAALNMAMRNIARALREQAITVVSLHPGWVKTDLGGPDAVLTVGESVDGMRKIIAGLTLDQSGSFLGYDGAIWPW